MYERFSRNTITLTKCEKESAIGTNPNLRARRTLTATLYISDPIDLHYFRCVEITSDSGDCATDREAIQVAIYQFYVGEVKMGAISDYCPNALPFNVSEQVQLFNCAIADTQFIEALGKYFSLQDYRIPQAVLKKVLPEAYKKTEIEGIETPAKLKEQFHLERVFRANYHSATTFAELPTDRQQDLILEAMRNYGKNLAMGYAKWLASQNAQPKNVLANPETYFALFLAQNGIETD